MATRQVIQHALGAAALAVALAGCPLNHSSTMAMSSTRSASASTASSSPTAATSADRGPGEQTSGIRGAIVRSQLETLHGLTPDQAKLQLKRLGHDGNVRLGVVTNSGGGETFLKECGVNKVCSTSGESGIGVHDDITLYLNPTLTIAPPPP